MGSYDNYIEFNFAGHRSFNNNIFFMIFERIGLCKKNIPFTLVMNTTKQYRADINIYRH